MTSGRERFEKRVAPALAGVLEPGERVTASGFAMIPPRAGTHALMGALAAFTSKYFWIAATDHRVVVLRLQKMGTSPEFERAAPRHQVRVLAAKRRLLDQKLTVQIGDTTYPLKFPMQWRRDGEAIARELTASPSTPASRLQ